MHVGVLRMLSQTTSSIPRKAAKRGRKPNQEVLLIFVGALGASDRIENIHSINKHVSEFCIKKVLLPYNSKNKLVFRFSNQQSTSSSGV